MDQNQNHVEQQNQTAEIPTQNPQSQSQPQNPQNARAKNNLLVPIAIVVAGALIAGALYFSHGNAGGANGTQVAGSQTTAQADQAQNGVQGSVENVLPLASADHELGDVSAPITLIEYSDLECPFCKEFQATMNTIMDTYGKNGQVAWVYRQFPLYQTLHPKALNEAEASECVAELGGNADFWKFVNSIYAITPSNNGLDPSELPIVATQSGVNTAEFNVCLSSGKYQAQVEQNYQDALKAGGTGTPYIVLDLKTPLNAATQQAIVTNMNAALAQVQPGAALPAGFISFSADGTRVAWEGAFPITVVEAAFDTILKNQ